MIFLHLMDLLRFGELDRPRNFQFLHLNSIANHFENFLDLYKKLFCFSDVFNFIYQNSSNINLFNSPLSHVKEIVSTNLTPNFINYFLDEKWSDLTPKNWSLIDEYKYYCGQLFKI